MHKLWCRLCLTPDPLLCKHRTNATCHRRRNTRRGESQVAFLASRYWLHLSGLEDMSTDPLRYKFFGSSFWTFPFVHWLNSWFRMVCCLFTEIYWSIGKDIFKKYYGVLYSDLNKTAIRFISQIRFHLNTGKIANTIAHQKGHIEIQKPVEVLVGSYLDL